MGLETLIIQGGAWGLEWLLRMERREGWGGEGRKGNLCPPMHFELFPHPSFRWHLHTRTENVPAPIPAPSPRLTAIFYLDSWLCAQLHASHHVSLPSLRPGSLASVGLLSTGYLLVLPQPHLARV